MRIRESKRRNARSLTYQGNGHQEAIEQFFEINDILPNMCEGGSKFDAEDFHEKARVKYIRGAAVTSATRTAPWTS